VKRTTFTTFALALLGLLGLGACRGAPSDEPPLYVFPDMDWQPKIQGQEEFPQDGKTFWADGRGNRQPVPGTVARGHLDEDEGLYQGKKDGAFLAKAPIEVTEKTLARGEERFNIYCAPCHDRTGSGNGMVIQRSANAFPKPPEFFGDRVRGLSDGEIFDTITHGIRNMPGYAYQIPAQDRWAIITWVRVLGRAGHGTLDDVPADARGHIEAAQ
jgi:mono/diheme cytochrome c family protein